MPRKSKFSQEYVDNIHDLKSAGVPLKDICKRKKLSRNQLNYILYTRSKTEMVISVDQFNNKSQKALGSAPPPQNVWIELWQKVKSVLGLKGKK
jgi:hypothetical protein|tara:strand:+ start:121 stop:402 length:282 start_codon:yes stop_codon:yes gene_type:complete